MNEIQLSLRMSLARTLQSITQGYGGCGCCEMPWKYCRGHMTRLNDEQGCFPLCEWCWSNLTIEERMPYYRKMMRSWEVLGRDKAINALVEKAVLEGR